MDVGEIVRATVHYVRPFSSANQNVFHWELADSDVDDDDVVLEIADWVENQWGAEWSQEASGQTTLSEVTIQIVLSDGTVVRNLGEPQIDLTGTVGDGVLAAATSAYLQANTDLPQIRGAKYVPGYGEDAMNNGAWTNDMLLSLGLLLIEYLLDINVPAGGILLAGVLSTKLEQFQTFNNTGAIEQIPAYQRRRKPQVGE